MKVELTSLIIIILSLFFLFKDDKPFNSRKIFNIFSLFFFGIAPLVQFGRNVSFFNARALFPNEYFTLNLILIIILLCFNFLYSLIDEREFKIKIPILQKHEVRNLYFLMVAILFFLNRFLFFDSPTFQNFFLRHTVFGLPNVDSSVQKSILAFLSYMPGILAVHLYLFWEGKMSLFRVSILILLIFCSFPTSLSRTAAAAIYLPVLLMNFYSFTKSRTSTVLMSLGLCYIFPFFNQFRKITSARELSFKPDFGVFSTAHFDSYYNFALIYNEVPIQHGRQLLGVLLFFVPRSLWENKPEGSGAFMAHKVGMNWDNVSANYFAEGYINFGIVGILAFLLILIFVCVLIDKFGTETFKYGNKALQYIYLQILFLLFFALRGDLLTGVMLVVSFTIYNIFAIGTLYKFSSEKE